MGLYSNFRMDLSFQEKKIIEKPILGCREIKLKPSLIFLEYPLDDHLKIYKDVHAVCLNDHKNANINLHLNVHINIDLNVYINGHIMLKSLLI